MTDLDPISVMAAQIRAKASKAAAANKTATSSTTKKMTVQTPKTIPDIYKGVRYDSVIVGKREKYLRSIDSGFLKQAAAEQGINIKFGRDPASEAWKKNNPELLAKWTQIMERMAALKASANATAQILSEPPIPQETNVSTSSEA
ncbi:MAG TPA: hypothetical protein VIN59_01305 [Alphaproteobacteria bacterium]